MATFQVGNSGHSIEIQDGWLVLDVGSGHQPHPRADVLLDNDVSADFHRAGQRIRLSERAPFVLGDAECLPFRRKSFDYVIVSHVAEHVSDPWRFCTELMRVSRAGYIETPSKFGEILLSEPFHRWFVYVRGGELVFERKHDPYLLRGIAAAFYSIFYLNQTRPGHSTIRISNKWLSRSSKLAVTYLMHLPWRRARRLTYTCFEWTGNFRFHIRGRAMAGGCRA